jgi:5-methylcytosine-specific restriction endonuclease McrA
MRRSSEIDDTRRAVFERDGWRCVVCGARATQVAHVLPQDVLHVRRYGKAVIHHPLNLRAVCDLRCNARVQINYRARPLVADQRARTIKEAIDAETTT